MKRLPDAALVGIIHRRDVIRAACERLSAVVFGDAPTPVNQGRK